MSGATARQYRVAHAHAAGMRRSPKEIIRAYLRECGGVPVTPAEVAYAVMYQIEPERLMRRYQQRRASQVAKAIAGAAGPGRRVKRYVPRTTRGPKTLNDALVLAARLYVQQMLNRLCRDGVATCVRTKAVPGTRPILRYTLNPKKEPTP